MASAGWLRTQLQRLTVLPFAPEDIQEHLKALADMPEPVLRAAVDHALKTRARFPVPAELRADADRVAPVVPALDVPWPSQEQPVPQPFQIVVPHVGTVISVTRAWGYHCDRCRDIGWASWWCGAERPMPWMDLARCGRREGHGDHEWVQHCACYDSNPALLRRRASQRKYAEKSA